MSSRPARRTAEAEANSTRIAPLPFFVAIALSRWTLTQLDRKFNRLSCAENSCADAIANFGRAQRSEEHTSELQSRENLVCRLLLEKKKKKKNTFIYDK